MDGFFPDALNIRTQQVLHIFSLAYEPITSQYLRERMCVDEVCAYGLVSVTHTLNKAKGKSDVILFCHHTSFILHPFLSTPTFLVITKYCLLLGFRVRVRHVYSRTSYAIIFMSYTVCLAVTDIEA